jgi:hypothetical protein
MQIVDKVVGPGSEDGFEEWNLDGDVSGPSCSGEAELSVLIAGKVNWLQSTGYRSH